MKQSSWCRSVTVGLAALLLLGLTGLVACTDGPGSSGGDGSAGDGWLEVVFEADPTDVNATSSAMDEATDVIEARLDGLDLAEYEVRRQGSWQIVVLMRGVEDQDRVVRLLGKTVVLEFYHAADFGMSYASKAEALASVGAASEEDLPEGYKLITWPAEEQAGGQDPLLFGDEFYVTSAAPKLTGANVESAGYGEDTSRLVSYHVITMEFDEEGAEIFRQLTRDLAELGADPTWGLQRLAVVLDGVVQTAPIVQEEISGGQAEIAGAFTAEEARDLALMLQTGRLPVELSVVSQGEVVAP